MERGQEFLDADPAVRSDDAIVVAQVPSDVGDPTRQIMAQLGSGPFALICLFVSPSADFANIVAATRGRFGAADVLACTTAGEIGQHGYEEDQIIAVAFRQAHFKAATYEIEGIDTLDEQSVAGALIETRLALAQTTPDWSSEFAFLLVDGLSLREEQLTAFLSSGLGPTPLFGGSSGDGMRFGQTWLARNGQVMQNSAIVVVVRCDRPVRVFSLNHLIPNEQRMVVTSASPDDRLVHEFNAEPAALEYARMLGLDRADLDQRTFAEHPVVVRLGDTHHVRAIQQVRDNHDLVFFSGINEGMVLSMARHDDIVAHLDRSLLDLAAPEKPQFILGCDCILRRIEAGRAQKMREVSEVLCAHHVVGFSTYGEQIGGLHVNQTLTGVAIYPPVTGAAQDIAHDPLQQKVPYVVD